jgi:hypothetical protein
VLKRNYEHKASCWITAATAVHTSTHAWCRVTPENTQSRNQARLLNDFFAEGVTSLVSGNAKTRSACKHFSRTAWRGLYCLFRNTCNHTGHDTRAKYCVIEPDSSVFSPPDLVNFPYRKNLRSHNIAELFQVLPISWFRIFTYPVHFLMLCTYFLSTSCNLFVSRTVTPCFTFYTMFQNLHVRCFK